VKKHKSYSSLIVCLIFTLLALALVSCNMFSLPDGSGDGSDIISTEGRLTVTGLGNYIGHNIDGDSQSSVKRISVFKEAVNTGDRFGFRRLLVTGDSVTLKVYETIIRGISQSSSYAAYIGYNGNDRNITINFYSDKIFHISDDGMKVLQRIGSVTVSFTNGIATGVFVPSPNN